MALPKTGLGSSRIRSNTLNDRFKNNTPTNQIPTPQTTPHVRYSDNRSEEPKRQRFVANRNTDLNIPTPQTSKFVMGSDNRSGEQKRTTFNSNAKKDFDVTTLGSVIDKLPTGVYIQEANAEMASGRSAVETPDFNTSGLDSSGALDEMVDETPSGLGDAARGVAIAGGGGIIGWWNQFGSSGKTEETSKSGPVVDGSWIDEGISGFGSWWEDKKGQPLGQILGWDTESKEDGEPYESKIEAFGVVDTGQVLNEREYIKETASGTDFDSGLDLEGRQAAYALYGRGYIPGSESANKIAELGTNVPAKDNFNTFTTPAVFDPMIPSGAIAESKSDNPDAWASVGTVGKWANMPVDSTMKINNKNPSAETHGIIQTSMNQGYLDNQYNNISNVWKADFTLKFGSDDQPTKEEAREFIDSAKGQIANQDNIGGYNMGEGYQDMYIKELESKMTNLYGLPGQAVNDGRPDGVKKTTAEKLLDKQAAGIKLNDKEKRKLETLTGNKGNKSNLSYDQIAFNTMKSNYLDVNPGAQGLPLGGKALDKYNKQQKLGQIGGGVSPTISWEKLASTAYSNVTNKKGQSKPIDYYNYFG